MAPVQQLARRKNRGRPAQTIDPSSFDLVRRLATAAATEVAQRRHLVNVQVHQDTTAELKRDLNEIWNLLRSVLPGAASHITYRSLLLFDFTLVLFYCLICASLSECCKASSKMCVLKA